MALAGGGGGATVEVVTVSVAVADPPGPPLERAISELIVFEPLAVDGGVTETLRLLV